MSDLSSTPVVSSTPEPRTPPPRSALDSDSSASDSFLHRVPVVGRRERRRSNHVRRNAVSSPIRPSNTFTTFPTFSLPIIRQAAVERHYRVRPDTQVLVPGPRVTLQQFEPSHSEYWRVNWMQFVKTPLSDNFINAVKQAPLEYQNDINIILLEARSGMVMPRRL